MYHIKFQKGTSSSVVDKLAQDLSRSGGQVYSKNSSEIHAVLNPAGARYARQHPSVVELRPK